MGLGLALSGISNIGHDVGGFAGPQPDGELLLRWVQNGIFHPRFVIHSWNDDGSVTEPWTHPHVLPQIRDAMALRYRLLPYLLYLLVARRVRRRTHVAPGHFWTMKMILSATRTRMISCWAGIFWWPMWSNKAPANAAVYLPRNATGWWDFQLGHWYAGGQWLDLPVTLDSIPLFVRAGAVLPLASSAMRATPKGRNRARSGTVPRTRGGHATFFHILTIDGDNADALSGNHCLTRVSLAKGQHGACPVDHASGQSALPVCTCHSRIAARTGGTGVVARARPEPWRQDHVGCRRMSYDRAFAAPPLAAYRLRGLRPRASALCASPRVAGRCFGPMGGGGCPAEFRSGGT